MDEKLLPLETISGYTALEWYPWGSENPEEVPLSISEINDNLDGIPNPVEHDFDILWNREQHINRILYLIKNGWEDSITIDTGIPGYFAPRHPIGDGHHRVVAAIVLNHKSILADANGRVDLFDELCEGTHWDDL